MTKRGEIAGTAVVAAILLATAHYLLQPAPISALFAVGGGLVMFWIARRQRILAMTIGWLLGAGLGILYHLLSHDSEGRVGEPPEGMVVHLALDGLLGMLVAAGALTLSVLSFQAAARRAGL